MSNQKIKIEEIALRLDEDESVLAARIATILGIGVEDIDGFEIAKKAIDSRNKRRIMFVYSVVADLKIEVGLAAGSEAVMRHKARFFEPYIYKIPKISEAPEKRPVIVGSGPCGLFAALVLARAGMKPSLLERGRDVDTRVKDVERFFKEGKLDRESNIQFGEGGAGTFSDGKLNTLVNNPRTAFIFEELVKAGAPAEIMYDAKPHVGTDKLRQVVRGLREEIVSLGGEVRFGSRLADIVVGEGAIRGVRVDEGDMIEVDNLVLAVGHSARDTYGMLFERGLEMMSKPFAIGVRIEHKREMIDRAQYGDFYDQPKLGAARYKLVAHNLKNRSVYTFCMCPGGNVVAAASEDGAVVTNGMSEYAQDGENSNSALLVGVKPADFGSDHPLAGVEFQQHWERKAFALAGGDYRAPAQYVGDFLNGEISKKEKGVKPTYQPGISFCRLADCLPEYVIASLKEALPLLNNKVRGFADPEALLTGVETRSSSPLRILRDETYQSNIRGIYPAGEGAGYAGGIVSSAIDGMLVAEAIIAKHDH